jgi:hypothetical protein
MVTSHRDKRGYRRSTRPAANDDDIGFLITTSGAHLLPLLSTNNGNVRLPSRKSCCGPLTPGFRVIPVGEELMPLVRTYDGQPSERFMGIARDAIEQRQKVFAKTLEGRGLKLCIGVLETASDAVC